MPDTERTDRVNENLILTQRTAGLNFGTDALLLAAYVRRGEGARALELGGGSGIISLLLATRRKVREIECVEIQPEYAALAERNVRENGLEERVTVVCADLRDTAAYGAGDFDIVVTNPPYMRADTPACRENEKQIARHEVNGGIRDFVGAARVKLRWGGRFFCVWRPDRLTDLMVALREGGLEPKRMTCVQANAASAPSVVLVESVRGGKSGLTVTPPLIIGGTLTERADSPDMTVILNEGRFPERYE